jgi:hypothetical protein
MIEIAGETFADEKTAEACITYLLEMKFGKTRTLLRGMTFGRKKELYKSAKRKWNKRRAKCRSL